MDRHLSAWTADLVKAGLGVRGGNGRPSLADERDFADHSAHAPRFAMRLALAQMRGRSRRQKLAPKLAPDGKGQGGSSGYENLKKPV